MDPEEFISRFHEELVRLGMNELIKATEPPLIPAARYFARCMLAGWVQGMSPEEVAQETYDGFVAVKNKLFIEQ